MKKKKRKKKEKDQSATSQPPQKNSIKGIPMIKLYTLWLTTILSILAIPHYIQPAERSSLSSLLSSSSSSSAPGPLPTPTVLEPELYGDIPLIRIIKEID